MESGYGVPNSPYVDAALPTKKRDLTSWGISAERGKPVVLLLGVGRSQERPMGQRAEELGKSERRSVIERIGVAPSGNIIPPARGLTSLWSFVTRELGQLT